MPLVHKDSPDEAVQDQPVVAPNIPGTTLSFDGIVYPGVGCFCAPPDTNGEVGLTQYVQIVNGGIQVFNKTRARPCWALWASPRSLLVSAEFVRTMATATRSCFTTSSRTAGSSASSPAPRSDRRMRRRLDHERRHRVLQPIRLSSGDELFRLPEALRLARRLLHEHERVQHRGDGLPRPAAVRFRPREDAGRSRRDVRQPGNHQRGGPLSPRGPRWFDPPCCGRPGHVRGISGSGVFRVFHFHADFAVPANTTFTLFASPASAGFTQLCSGTRACVPQLGETAPNNLDGIGDRLMHRLAYRNFGGFESVVGNFSVSAGAWPAYAGSSCAT